MCQRIKRYKELQDLPKLSVKTTVNVFSHKTHRFISMTRLINEEQRVTKFILLLEKGFQFALSSSEIHKSIQPNFRSKTTEVLQQIFWSLNLYHTLQ